MTDQEYSQAEANFASALSQFAERLEGLVKPPLKVPEICESSDDAEKREALRQMLDSLASADDKAALSADDILRAADFFARLYGGEEPYRHRYADVCVLVFEKLGQAGDDLDDGVPYSINCLAENIRIIHAQLVEQGHCDQARSVLKLADHIDLEKTRASRDIKQRQTMRDFRKAIESVEDERVEAEKQRVELEKEFDGRLEKTRMEYIGILGVFAAVVLTFNGGVEFSTSVIGEAVAGGPYLLILLSALVGFVLINAVCMLLLFLWKMSFNQKRSSLGKWLPCCLLGADAVLVVIVIVMFCTGRL